jgi:hypothetical protein
MWRVKVWENMDGKLEETKRKLDALKEVCTRAEMAHTIAQHIYATDERKRRNWDEEWADIVATPILEEHQKELDAAVAGSVTK